jgi:hypothetical protein
LWWGHGFCWGLCESGCAERGFLYGKRGDVVVNVWLEVTEKTWRKLGQLFCVFIFREYLG